MNGNIFVSCGMLYTVVCSAVEAALIALFLNIKGIRLLRLALKEPGHIQATNTSTLQQQHSCRNYKCWNRETRIALDGNKTIG